MQYENVPSISDMVASSSICSSSFSVKVSWQCEIIAFECKTNTELLFLALGSPKKKRIQTQSELSQEIMLRSLKSDFHWFYAPIKERKHLNFLSNEENVGLLPYVVQGYE